jgi:hypothetical protein
VLCGAAGGGKGEDASRLTPGVQLCVADLRAAREKLLERGVEVGEIQVFEGGKPRRYREGDSLDIVGFALFSDPDGNGWAIQQMPGRR